MWTVKRFLILVGGLLLALSNYAVYALFLGNIDGLAPLPPEYVLEKGSGDGAVQGPIVSNVDQKLEQAFGAGCEEVQRPLKLLSDGRVFAAGEFNIDSTDGRVRLQPFSAALVHKNKVPGGFPEISTIKCEVAYLTLDRPVAAYSELNGRKVIAIEMRGKQPTGIILTNNRGTAEKGDDVEVFITNGHLFYEERRNLIWSDGIVRLTDYQSKPPTKISGKGLEMVLAKDTGPNHPKQPAKAKPAQPHSDSNNIEKITLRTDVDMNFWVDGKSGFLGGAPPPKNPPASAVAAPRGDETNRAHIHITTPGTFVYDLTKEYAWYESPTPLDGAEDPLAPDQVHVTRSQTVNNEVFFDQLTCHRLDLQFRRKPGVQIDSTAGPAGDKDIETAKAIRRGNTEVILTLQSEKMAAFGSEMFYRAGDAVNGPLTILKGEPNRQLRTFKDGHKMVSDELHLFAANRAGEGQRAWARGPGQIDLLDGKSTAKEPSFPTHIKWKDTLTVVKVKEGGEVFDLMTVVEEASFIDDLQKQDLHGEKIMVWIRQVQESAKKAEASGGGKQELHRVFAQDRVHGKSQDFIIRRADRLWMTFLPETARNDRLPTLPRENEVKVVDNNSPAARPGEKSPAARPGEKPSPLPPPGTTPTNKAPEEKKKPSPPIELEGNEITMVIVTLPEKKQLQEMIAKGNVFVFQAGETPGEKGLDIRGQLLTIHHAELGDTMIVHGDAKALARLELGDTIIWGPLVTINQAINKADVDGAGAMQMPSNKNLDGTESTKAKDKGKPERITIHWNKYMTFDGQYADFNGGVEAYQDDAYSKLLCEKMTAILDKVVSFKQGQKKDKGAKIERIVCDRKIFIDDAKVDERKQLAQRNILTGKELINRQDGATDLVGPGIVRTLALGGADVGLNPPPAGAPANNTKPKDQDVWKQTRVDFRDRMFSNTKANTKNAKFYGSNAGVDVYHFPTADINAVMNANKPPKDGFYLQCDVLTVEGRQHGNKTTQYMVAEGANVFFKTDLYVGNANIVKYDESTDIVIFESTNGNVVRLSKIVNGKVENTVVNTKVLYNRKTGELKSEGVKSISN